MRQRHVVLASTFSVAAGLSLLVAGPTGSTLRAAGVVPFGARYAGAVSRPNTHEVHLSGTVSAQQTLVPATTASGAPLTVGPHLVVGSERANRLVAGRLSDIRSYLGTGKREFPARVVSPEVGAAMNLFALPGQRLVATATNQPDLVLLTNGLHTIRTLDVRTPLGSGSSPISYGSMARHGTSLYLAAAWGNNVAALTVDIDTWSLVRWRVLPGRYASFPEVCLTEDGVLAVASTTHVSLLRPADLATVTEVKGPEKVVGGLACGARDVVVSGYATPTLYRYDSAGKAMGTLTWARAGGSSEIVLRNGVAYVADDATSTVARCDLAARRCTSAALDGRPASVFVTGDLLFLALDSREDITVLDATTLAVRGHLPMPGGPRAFALLD